MKFILPTCQVLGLALFAQSVNGHATLTNPAPRPSASGQIEKDPQRPPSAAKLEACAGRPRGAPTAEFKAGETITIDWLVAAKHGVPPGVTVGIRYQDGEAITNLLTGADIDAHPTQVTLPVGKVSDTATIVWFWDSSDDGGFYLDCADVKVTAESDADTPVPAGGGNNPGGVNTGTPNPNPGGVNTGNPPPNTGNPPPNTGNPPPNTGNPPPNTGNPPPNTGNPPPNTGNPPPVTNNPPPSNTPPTTPVKPESEKSQPPTTPVKPESEKSLVNPELNKPKSQPQETDQKTPKTTTPGETDPENGTDGNDPNCPEDADKN